MSIEIAKTLREEADKARGLADRQSRTEDQEILRRLAAKLTRIAGKLERDARD